MTDGSAGAHGLARAIAARADAEREVLLADLARWVAMDSQTWAIDDVNALALDIATTLERYGLEVETPDSAAGLHVIGSIDGPGTARIGLLCHHDTVFPAGTAERWPLRIDGDRVNGPGVCDMKGGIVVAAHAARLLADSSAFARVELISVPDEEERDGPPPTLDRFAGFDAVLCMECGRLDGSVVSARKGGRWLRVTVNGRGAHAGVIPEDGRNAAAAICSEAIRIGGLDGERDGLTVQLTSLRAGEGINTVPPTATAVFDARGLLERDLEWLEDRAGRSEDHDGITFALEVIARTPALERTKAVVSLARRAASLGEVLGAPAGEVATGGTSDAAWVAAEGIPVLDGLGPVGDHDHTEDEYAVISTFAPRIGMVAGLVASVDVRLLTATAAARSDG